MATRSTIAYKTIEGKIRAVYAHWDGYPAGNGRILEEHYTDGAKIAALVGLGNISSLRPMLGEEHPFSSLDVKMDSDEYDALYGEMTTFYGRDRGEKDSGPKDFDTINDWIEYYDGCGCEYFYLYAGDSWIVNAYAHKDNSGLFHKFNDLEMIVAEEIARLRASGYEV